MNEFIPEYISSTLNKSWRVPEKDFRIVKFNLKQLKNMPVLFKDDKRNGYKNCFI